MPARLLVVDDDPAVRESLRRALTIEGYDLDVAEYGADGLGPYQRAPTSLKDE